MKIFLTLLLLTVLLPAPTARAENPTCPDLLAQSEALWIQLDYDAGDRILDQAIGNCPNSADVYWRRARNIYDRIESLPRDQHPPKDELLRRYQEMLRLTEIGLQKDGKNGNCLFWKGVALGRIGSTQGILRSLADVDDLEALFLKVEKIAPSYRALNGAADTLGDTYTALGQLYRIVPEWLCTFPFKQMVGTCGDLKKSIQYQREAVAREPKRIEYQKELGISLLCYGRQHNDTDALVEGRQVLKNLSRLPAIKPSDTIDKQHAGLLLQNETMACGYCRDAQQNQDQSGWND